MSSLMIKNCLAFEPLRDGTLLGDSKYCELSFQCKQVGMKSEYVEITLSTGEIVYDFLCTGKKIEDLEENKELIKAT